MRLCILSIVSMWLTAIAAETQRHVFTSGDHIVTMDVRVSDPYLGRRLVFYSDSDPRKDICLVGNGEKGACPNLFVGTVATVTFSVKRLGRKLPRKTLIREYVTVTGQSPDLPPRAQLDKTQVLKNGVITDLQAFGYDESDIAAGERESERQKSRARLWRLCRQELYLNDETEPFAIISWRYTLEAIEILRVQRRNASSTVTGSNPHAAP